MNVKNKSELRKHFSALLETQKEDGRTHKNQVICDKFFQLPEVMSGQTILFYASYGHEVDTFAMMQGAIDRNKTVVLPKVDKQSKTINLMTVTDLNNLESGAYGIQEPVADKCSAANIQDIDVAVIPGIAFDRQGNRLGRGAGYYDRFLSTVSSQLPTVGLAYDVQYVDQLPFVETHDIPVTQVLTN